MTSALLWALAIAGTLATDESAALADRQQFPPDQHWRYYYVSTASGHPDLPKDLSEQARQATALKLAIPSVSRQVVLEKCVPVQVGPTLYRMDLADLQWDAFAWQKFIKNYPYSKFENPILLRADWLCTHLMDANEQGTPAYYELLFGKVPKTRDEALAALGVNIAEQFQFGQIEGRSGVSVAGVRWIANLPIERGYAWGTRDVFELTRDKDMLELPDGSFKHDGEEWIIGLWKKHQATGTQGALQAYFLTNGEGGVVQRADVRLVEDHTKFRGLAEIRVAGSCIQCHQSGLNYPTTDDFRDALGSGVVATADYKNKEKIEAFHFSDLKKEIRRNNEDFAAIVELACGCSPERAAAAFAATVRTYDRPLTPARGAWELGVARDELRLALAFASSGGAQLPARIAGLAHGRDCPRVAFEPAYEDLRYSILPAWKEKP
jgi:hypothetical protein